MLTDIAALRFMEVGTLAVLTTDLQVMPVGAGDLATADWEAVHVGLVLVEVLVVFVEVLVVVGLLVVLVVLLVVCWAAAGGVVLVLFVELDEDEVLLVVVGVVEVLFEVVEDDEVVLLVFC